MLINFPKILFTECPYVLYGFYLCGRIPSLMSYFGGCTREGKGREEYYMRYLEEPDGGAVVGMHTKIACVIPSE